MLNDTLMSTSVCRSSSLSILEYLSSRLNGFDILVVSVSIPGEGAPLFSINVFNSSLEIMQVKFHTHAEVCEVTCRRYSFQTVFSHVALQIELRCIFPMRFILCGEQSTDN